MQTAFALQQHYLINELMFRLSSNHIFLFKDIHSMLIEILSKLIF